MIESRCFRVQMFELRSLFHPCTAPFLLLGCDMRFIAPDEDWSQVVSCLHNIWS